MYANNMQAFIKHNESAFQKNHPESIHVTSIHKSNVYFKLTLECNPHEMINYEQRQHINWKTEGTLDNMCMLSKSRKMLPKHIFKGQYFLLLEFIYWNPI